MWDKVRTEVALGQKMVAPPWLIRQLVNLKLPWIHKLQCGPVKGLEAAQHSGQSHDLSLDPTPFSPAVGKAEGLEPKRASPASLLPPCPHLAQGQERLPEGSVQTHRPADPRGLRAASNTFCNGLETEARRPPQGHPYRFSALPTPLSLSPGNFSPLLPSASLT